MEDKKTYWKNGLRGKTKMQSITHRQEQSAAETRSSKGVAYEKKPGYVQMHNCYKLAELCCRSAHTVLEDVNAGTTCVLHP